MTRRNQKKLPFSKKGLHLNIFCDTIIKLSVRRYAAVAQLDRVTGYEPVGRGFESLQPYQNVLMKDTAQKTPHESAAFSHIMRHF